MLLWPLFVTSFVVDDFLGDHACSVAPGGGVERLGQDLHRRRLPAGRTPRCRGGRPDLGAPTSTSWRGSAATTGWWSTRISPRFRAVGPATSTWPVGGTSPPPSMTIWVRTSATRWWWVTPTGTTPRSRRSAGPGPAPFPVRARPDRQAPPGVGPRRVRAGGGRRLGPLSPWTDGWLSPSPDGGGPPGGAVYRNLLGGPDRPPDRRCVHADGAGVRSVPASDTPPLAGRRPLACPHHGPDPIHRRRRFRSRVRPGRPTTATRRSDATVPTAASSAGSATARRWWRRCSTSTARGACGRAPRRSPPARGCPPARCSATSTMSTTSPAPPSGASRSGCCRCSPSRSSPRSRPRAKVRPWSSSGSGCSTRSATPPPSPGSALPFQPVLADQLQQNRRSSGRPDRAAVRPRAGRHGPAAGRQHAGRRRRLDLLRVLQAPDPGPRWPGRATRSWPTRCPAARALPLSAPDPATRQPRGRHGRAPPGTGPGLAGRGRRTPTPTGAGDGHPARRSARDRALEVVSRLVPAATMVVTRDPGELYLLRHTAGEDAVSFVERIDPADPGSVGTARRTSPAGRPGPAASPPTPTARSTWCSATTPTASPPTSRCLAGATLPRPRPVQRVRDPARRPPGHQGLRRLPPGAPGAGRRHGSHASWWCWSPSSLGIVDRLHAWPNRRSPGCPPTGTRSTWSGTPACCGSAGTGASAPTTGSGALPHPPGQTYGWDCVIAIGAAWFLDNGEGSEALLGHAARPRACRGTAAPGADRPRRRHRAPWREVCDRPGGLVANPPVVDADRSVAVGYDSGNGVMAGVRHHARTARLAVRWRRAPASTPATWSCTRRPGSWSPATTTPAGGPTRWCVLDIGTGEELARADTGSPVQSVLFPAAGFDDDLYLCTFTTVTRSRWHPAVGSAHDRGPIHRCPDELRPGRRPGVGQQLVVVGQQGLGQVPDHLHHLGMVLGVPPLQQLGHRLAPGDGELLDRLVPPRGEHQASGASVPHGLARPCPPPPGRPRPRAGGLGSTLRRAPTSSMVEPAGRPAGRGATRPGAGGRAPPEPPASRRTRPVLAAGRPLEQAA